MTILVTCATSRVGSLVSSALEEAKVDVRVLTRSRGRADISPEVSDVRGCLADIDGMRAALADVDTLFLDGCESGGDVVELLSALNVAREAGVRGIVYMSAFQSDRFSDVIRLSSRHMVERVIDAHDLPATVLRPSYIIQDDAAQKDDLLDMGLYTSPVGHVGVAMVDARDVAAAAVQALLTRERASVPLPRETYDLLGRESLAGPALADIWSSALARDVRYAGDDLAGIELRLRRSHPAWLAYDAQRLFRQYQAHGAPTSGEAVEAFAALLGHEPRLYRDFALECAASWSTPSS